MNTMHKVPKIKMHVMMQ